MIPRMYCKKCYFFSHLIHTFICPLLKSQYNIPIGTTVKIFHTNYFLLHIFILLLFVPYFCLDICIVPCVHQHHLHHIYKERHIIVIVINNIMRPYGTQLCSVLTRTRCVYCMFVCSVECI